jgi:hypothetical protein
MELVCIKDMAAYWGSILTSGKSYKVKNQYEKSITFITDYDMYWKYVSMIARSITWIRKGYTQETLHEVMPGYLIHSEVMRLYTKSVMAPHFDFATDDNSTESMCVLSDGELISMGADIAKGGKRKGKASFSYTVHLLDDYFDYQGIRRDNKLNGLGL